MSNIVAIMQSVVPEVNDLFASRLAILRALQYSDERIGRKMLANETHQTERAIRTSLDSLKAQALVDVNYQGVGLTSRGEKVLKEIDALLFDNNQNQFYELEEALRRKLAIERCFVIPGDADEDDSIYRLIGKVVQDILVDYLPTGNNVISVTGGSTLAKVGEAFTEELTEERTITFVPSRGGLGGNVNIQSNSVGSLMAMRTNSEYIPLFIPEDLDKETSELLLKDATIKYVVEMSKQANCLLLSVGTAQVMAERRNITSEQLEIIQQKQAVGEAFGVFFDSDGEVVVRYPRVGLKIEDLSHIPLLLTIVGGSSKAEAVEAFFKLAPNHGWLICDEGIANKILNGETL